MPLNVKERPVLVTGGAGYIGSVLTGLLLRDGFKIRVVDNLNFGGEAVLSYLADAHFEFIHGDITGDYDLDKALEGVGAIIHLAAVVGDPACRKTPERAVQVNRTASEILCEKALERDIRRFVFASTCSNYGKTSEPDAFVDESSPLKPISLYAELKVGFENFLLSHPSDFLEPVCLRFATAYGLSPRPRFDLTVNEFTRDLLLDQTLEVYGEQFWRPYCHVLDLSEACRLALLADSSQVSRKALNVGATTENYRKLDLVETILAQMPKKRNNVSFVHKDEDPRDYRVNCDKIGQTLGFQPTRRVADGVREIIAAIGSGWITNPYDTRYSNV